MEDTIKETVSMRFGSNSKAKGKANETVTIALRPGIMRGSVRTSKKARAKAKASKENVTTAEKKDTRQENAPKEKVTKAKEKEKEKVTRAKVKEPVVGVKVVCGQ